MHFLAGQRVLAQTLNDLEEFSVPVFAEKTVDEVVNNSATLQNDDELFLPVTANGVYQIEGIFRFSSNTTADMKIAWTFPSGLTMRYSALGIAAADTAFTLFTLSQTDVMNWEGHASVDRSVQISGVVRVSATAGLLRVQWAQLAANASNTIMRAKSYLMLTRIS